MSKPDDKGDPPVSDENDVDALLDDALEDFNKPLPSLSAQRASSTTQGAPVAGIPAGGLLTEEMIKEATQNFEASMRAIMVQQQKVAEVQQVHGKSWSPGSGNSLAQQAPGGSTQLDLQSLTAQFAQFAQSATNVANNSNATSTANVATSEDSKSKTQEEIPDFQNLLTNAMQQMAENNEAFQSAPSAEELSQLMSGLGLGLEGGQEGEGGGLMTLMQSMLENVLSKEIIYPPIKEIVDKYPDWLADHRSSMDASDFNRYSRQFDVMKRIVDLFEAESESDSDEVKAKRFEDLVCLMQKLQEEGHPPPELAGELPPHLANVTNQDPGNAEAPMPDLSAVLGSLSAAMGDPSKTPNANDEQCSLM
ncbi:Pex19 protein [Trinorchestia longiramus]|nr:Pex19 protein [Trinorchestia longiramus]